MSNTEKSRRVLTVCAACDSPSMCALLRLSLKEPEFFLSVSSDPDSFIEDLSKRRPDVCLVASRLLQKLFGPSADAAAVRRLAGSVPLIVLIGAFDETGAEDQEWPEFRERVRMPFDSTELIRIVREAARNDRGGGRESIKDGPAGENPGRILEEDDRIRRIVREEMKKRENIDGIPEEPD